MSLAVVAPFDSFRTRQATNPSTAGNILSCYTDKRAYRGFFVAVGGIFAYRMLYFVIHDTVKELYRGGKMGWFGKQAPAILISIATYPIDTLHRFMIVGDMDVNRAIDAIGSPAGFYAGVGLNILRMLVGSLASEIYRKLHKCLSGRRK